MVPPPAGAANLDFIGWGPEVGLVVRGTNELGNPLTPNDVTAINRVRLISVTNYDQVYGPPTRHFGHPIDPHNVEIICRHVIRYIENMLIKARQFITEPA